MVAAVRCRKCTDQACSASRKPGARATETRGRIRRYDERRAQTVHRRPRRDDQAPHDPRAGTALEDQLLRGARSTAGHRLRRLQGLRGRDQRETAATSRSTSSSSRRHEIASCPISWLASAMSWPRASPSPPSATRSSTFRSRPRQSRQRDRGHGTAIAATDLDRRSRGQGSVRPQVIELLGAPRAAQREAQRRRQSRHHFAASARGSRRRRSSRDAQCRSLWHRYRRRLQAGGLVQGLPEDQTASRPGREQRRRDRLGLQAEQPAAEGIARRVPQDASPGDDLWQYAPQALPGQHAVRDRGAVARGDEEVSGSGRDCSGNTRASTTSTSC